MRRWVMLLFLLIPGTAVGAEVAGVSLPDTLSVEGEPLHLNGAGVRSKFFFDIYVGALYRPEPVRQAGGVLDRPAPSVVTMDFLYSEVAREKLTTGWSEGFRKNQSPESLRKLQTRLDRFNAMFADSRRGDRYRFDFRIDGRTVVWFNGKETGSIEGEDFQRALLTVWLGDRPADAALKRAMLEGK